MTADLSKPRRGRGRPPGSRNRRFVLATTVRKYCEEHQFDPVAALHAIATFTDVDPKGNPILWDQVHVYKARQWLADMLHNNKMGQELGDILEGDGSQYSLEFITSEPAHIALPGAPVTSEPAPVVRSEPIYGAGDPSPVWENGICNQSPDSRNPEVPV